MQIWLFALAGAVAPAPAQVMAASQSPNASKAPAPVTPDAPAVEATAATVPKKPLILDPPAKAAVAAFSAPKTPVILDPPGVAPKKPVSFEPPSKKGVALTAPKKPVIFSPPREATGWKAADAAQEVPATAPVAVEAPENSTGVALAVEDPSGTEAAKAPLVLKSIQNSTDVSDANATGVALAVEAPTDHGIHVQIAEAHKAMCEDGRMDSTHCEKFRNSLDDMQNEIKSMHDEHQTKMVDESAAAEEPNEAATAADPETATVSVEVESVKEHDPVIKKHEYPYKTGPCASGATAVALLFSGLLFA
jgi:hypothetical protein